MRASTMELARKVKKENLRKDVAAIRIGSFKDEDEDALDVTEQQRWARAETRLDEFIHATTGQTPRVSLRAWKHAEAIGKLRQSARQELRLLALQARLDAAGRDKRERAILELPVEMRHA